MKIHLTIAIALTFVVVGLGQDAHPTYACCAEALQTSRLQAPTPMPSAEVFATQSAMATQAYSARATAVSIERAKQPIQLTSQRGSTLSPIGASTILLVGFGSLLLAACGVGLLLKGSIHEQKIWDGIYYASTLYTAFSSYLFWWNLMVMAYDNEWIMVQSPIFPMIPTVLFLLGMMYWHQIVSKRVVAQSDTE